MVRAVQDQPGLRICSVGENPSVAEGVGHQRRPHPAICAIGGMLMGFAGAVHSLDYNLRSGTTTS
ncbi:MAG: hypothetical protein M9927_07695 [Anaerolineae bacterium]|nr:hypothetical protein [Anaerolineae bacterium]